MLNKNEPMKTTYLLAYVNIIDDKSYAYFQHASQQMYLAQHVVKVSMTRGNHRVVAFCDYIHGDDYLTKDELRLVAACYLDEHYETINIDLRN